MIRLFFLSLASLCLLSQFSWPLLAFEAIGIPNAKCGDQSPFEVFYREGENNNLLIVFEEGGVCWDSKTCFGPRILRRGKVTPTDIDDVKGQLLRENWDKNPFAEDSVLYIPYCTADVHAGDFSAYYSGRFGSLEVLHWGRRNLNLAFDYLIQKELIASPQNIDRLSVVGHSAGAVGALFNLNLLAKKFSAAKSKFLISDSPGLHFTSAFWDQFSDVYREGLYESMRLAELPTPDESASGGPDLLATLAKKCRLYPDWKLAILQGSKDVVMSKIFGKLSIRKHKHFVYGEEGLLNQLLKNGDSNCYGWWPNSYLHVFLHLKFPYEPSVNGLSPLDFVWGLLEGTLEQNHFFPNSVDLPITDDDEAADLT